MKRIISLLLTAALLVCCCPIAFAADDGVTVDLSCYFDDIVLPLTSVTVTEGLAAGYGIKTAEKDHNGKPVNGVTVLDAVVAAHAVLYGADFTPETCADYIGFADGFVTKLFGVGSASLGFAVNNASPHDDVFIESYGSFTGYSWDTALIADGDYIALFSYRDSWYSDYFPVLSADDLTVEPGESFELTARGYSICYYGCCSDEAIAAASVPMAGLSVLCDNGSGEYSELGVLDDSGRITLSFDDEGVYYLLVCGSVEDEDMGSVPAAGVWCRVNVKAAENDDDGDDTDGEKTLYFPCSLKIKVNFDNQSRKLTFSFKVRLFDIKRLAPETEKEYSLSLDLSFFARIFAVK